MFMCHDCGATFFEHNVVKWTEAHGETMCEWVCPECGSADFAEMAECCICGEEFDPDELTCDCCEECIEKMFTEDNLLAFALDDKEAFIEFVADAEIKKKNAGEIYSYFDSVLPEVL